MKWGRLLSLLALLCLGTLFATSAWASEAEADGGFSLPEEESLSKLREKAETFHFQAEVNRMMTLIINSLYRNKEIFLRELISNASDALDKIRFISLTNPKVLSEKSELSIKIQADPEHNALHIADSGIGMTKEDLIRNLGTIAKSGTADFLKKVEEGGDLSMIGQFGVGFYSVFLVADRVTVTTKHNDDKQYIWESTAESDFSIIEDPRGNTLGRGTVITLHLKPEASDYLKQDTLKSLIKKYSEFINFPIYLWTTTTEKVEVPVEEGEEADRREDEDEEELEDVTEDEDEDEDEEEDRPKTKLVDQAKSAFELVNESKPIWLRPTSEVEESEYKEFFKAFFKESEDPLATSHFKAEGEVEFRSLLFVPPRQPPNLYGTEPINEIKLFVRRVFITDTEAEPLLPTYLRFIKGVVDSDDLPLNVSRETLQQSKLLRVIKKKLTKKALDMLKDLSADSAAYLKFYKEFYNSIKLGIIEDASNRKRLAKLLRFKSSESPDEYISLDQYLERRKQKQSSIYFLTGSTVAELKASPFLERLSARGYEVLFLVDPIDEYTFQSLTEYEGKKFVNAAKDNLKLGDDDESEDLKELKEQFEPLLAWLNHTLTAHIQRVILSTRLTTSPCALVAPQFGWSGNMERIARSQAYAKPDDPSSSFYLNLKKNLEINPKHPVILNLLEKVRNEETDEDTVEIAKILFDTATLRSGYDLKDPVDFAARIEKMLRANLGVDLEAKAEVNEPKVPLASEGEEEDEDADAEPDFSFNPMDGMPEDDEADGHDEL